MIKQMNVIYINSYSSLISICFSFVILWLLTSKGVEKTILLGVFTAIPIAISSVFLNARIQNINKIFFYKLIELIKPILYLLFFLVYINHLSYIFIILLNMINAFILSFNFPLLMTMINDTSVNIKEMVRKATILNALVGVISPLLSSLLVENLTTPSILYLLFINQMIVLFFILKLKCVDKKMNRTSHKNPLIIENLKLVMRDRVMFVMIILIPFVGAIESSFPVFTSLYLQKHQLPAYYYGMFYSTLNISMLIGNFLLKYIKLNAYSILKYNFIIQGCGMLWVAVFWINLPLVISGLTIIGLMAGMAQLTVNLFIHEKVPKSQIGVSFSMLRLVSVCLQPITPLLLLSSEDSFVYLLAAIIMIAGLVNILLVKKIYA